MLTTTETRELQVALSDVELINRAQTLVRAITYLTKPDGLGHHRGPSPDLPEVPCGHDGRVVCLLDIMKEFAPDSIVHVVHGLVDAANNTSSSDSGIFPAGGEFDKSLQFMISEFEKCGLTSAFDLLRRLKVTLDDRALTASDVADKVNDLVTRIKDDMKRSLYLRLENDEPKYYNGTKLDWGDALVTHPITEDATEASRCFALGRYPAAAFHMMRVLDVGLHALADELGVPFSQHFNANWENVINDIEKKIRDIPTTDPNRKQKQNFYSAAANHFFFLKEAWRNYVMHVKQSHNQGTTLGVMLGVSEFMRQLAAKRPWLP